MSGNDVQRQIRGARVTRALFAVPAVILAVLSAVRLADGAVFLGVLSTLAAALFVVSAVLTTARIGLLRKTAARTGASLPPPAREAVLRRIASRPRRTMTPGDYRRLRELEAELGWEPSGLACDCGKSQEEHAREWDEQVIASQGVPPTRLTDGEVKDATEAAQHFAQLARVGLEHCIGFCPICAERDHR